MSGEISVVWPDQSGNLSRGGGDFSAHLQQVEVFACRYLHERLKIGRGGLELSGTSFPS